MTSDIVDRLRRIAEASRRPDGSAIPLTEEIYEARNEIIRLSWQRDELREALAKIASCEKRASGDVVDIARTVLSKIKGEA